MIIEIHADRRAAAGLADRRQTIDVIARRVGRPGPPDEIGPRRAVAKPHRAIPGQRLVPFHVAVEGEQFAVGAECGVEMVAEPAGDQSEVRPVRIATARWCRRGRECRRHGRGRR